MLRGQSTKYKQHFRLQGPTESVSTRRTDTVQNVNVDPERLFCEFFGQDQKV